MPSINFGVYNFQSDCQSFGIIGRWPNVAAFSRAYAVSSSGVASTCPLHLRCFLRGLAATFPCGALASAFPCSPAGGSGFCPIIASTSAHISASLASAGCAGLSTCKRKALVRSLHRHSTLRATPRRKKSSFPRASACVALLSSDSTGSVVSPSHSCKKCFVSPMPLQHSWQIRSDRGLCRSL